VKERVSELTHVTVLWQITADNHSSSHVNDKLAISSLNSSN